MPPRTRRRKILIAAGLTAAALLLLTFSLPVWFSWVLRPLARSKGAQYGQYIREGYTRFTLRGFSYTDSSVRFQADRIQALVPTVWLWRWLFGEQREEAPWLQISGWQLEPRPSGQSSASVYSDAQEWANRLQGLRRWLPVAELADGTARVQGTLIQLPSVTWSNGVLRTKISAPPAVTEMVLDLDAAKGSPYPLRIRSAPLHLDSSVRIATNASSIELEGTATWWTNRIDFQAQFGSQGTLPERASMEARGFRIPAGLVKLPEYQDITGSFSAKWERERYGVDLSASAQPQAAEGYWPPLRVSFHAGGDTNSVTIASATATAPWLQAELSREVKLYFHGPMLREPAQFKLTADLGQQRWVGLQGRLNGEADFSPTARKYPAARFRLSGSEVGNATLEARDFAVEGGLNWPWLEIARANAVFDDGSTCYANARMDLQTKVLEGGRIQVEGPLARRWLPKGYSYQNLSMSADFQGALQGIVHNGSLSITNLNSPQLRPLQVTAKWSGTNLNLARAEVEAKAGQSTLLAKGSVGSDATSTRVVLSALTLRTNGVSVMELGQPWGLELGRAVSSRSGGQRSARPTLGATYSNRWRLSATPLEWSGRGGQVHATGRVAWPVEGTLSASVQRLHSWAFADFVKEELGTFELRRLTGSAGWTNGPAGFGLDLVVTDFALPQRFGASQRKATAGKSLVLPPGPLSIELSLAGDQNGMVLSNLVVTAPTSAVAVAHGSLPLTLTPASPRNLVHLDERRPIQLAMRAEPNAFFWREISERSGITLGDPHLDLDIAGNWERPQGSVHLRARQVLLEKGPKTMPTLDNLELNLRLDRQEARVVNCQLLIQGQSVVLTGELPLSESFWRDVIEKKMPSLEKATARLRVEDAQLAALADVYPKYLSPQGELNADVSLLPGERLRGQVTVQGARTRPLSTLGPIRDISLQVQFAERALKLESATARIGGAPVLIQGAVDLRGTNWLQGALPPFQLTVRGTNVPLSRQPETIIRSDLNLDITRTNGAPPVVSGEAHLRDSFYLSDIRLLAPGKVAAPAKRPPYFSIDEPVLADWRLNVHVTGDRFLKVRNPVFNGEVSANLKLGGTLKDPVALGDVKIDSGAVRFPFATLKIQQGLVTLSSQDPYRPELTINAVSKQFGYDIKMEVTGPADKPVIQFTSTPPLGSEQILLMVTAGQLPAEQQVYSTTGRAQALGVYLGRDVLAKLGLGEGAEERLTIQSGEEITLQGTPTYRVEYQFSKRWSLVGEYDRFNDYDVGLRWRIYSK